MRFARIPVVEFTDSMRSNLLKTAAMVWMIHLALALEGAETFTTNLVTADSEFREVDGKLYNVNKSVRWKPMQGQYLETLTNGLRMYVEFGVERDGYQESPPPGSLARIGGLSQYSTPLPFVVTGYTTNYGGKFLVRNFDGPENRQNFMLLMVGKTNLNGMSFPLYDFGRPHVVPLIKTNSVKRGS